MKNIIILIVEDNKLNSQLISESLTTMGYSNKHIVDNYNAAIEFVYKTHPDLILMDIMLKRPKDGVIIARKILSKHDVPIIYITGYAQDKIIERVKDTNPYAFIKKPFKYDDLKANVVIALSKHKSIKKKNKERLKYVQAFLNMHCGVITTNVTGSVLFINKVAEVLTGFKSKEAKNFKFEEVFNISNSNYNSRTLLDETIRKGTVHKFRQNLKIKSKNGSEITLEIKTSTGNGIDNSFITIFFWEKPKTKKRYSIKNVVVGSTFSKDHKINLMVIGDNSLFRKGILNVLDTEDTIDIRCETTTKLEILECCTSKEIDLAIILDDSTDSDDIYETVNFLKKEIPGVKILVLYPGLEDERELNLMENAIQGVISYKEHNFNIPLAIHTIMKGDLWFRREILSRYINQLNSKKEIRITGKNKAFDKLSHQEKQIIAYASLGYKNKDIGIKLALAEGTIKNYLIRIYKKLYIKNKRALKTYSIKYLN